MGWIVQMKWYLPGFVNRLVKVVGLDDVCERNSRLLYAARRLGQLHVVCVETGVHFHLTLPRFWIFTTRAK